MSREIRMVPANWDHPKDKNGHLAPLLGHSFTKRLAKWREGKERWGQGLSLNYSNDKWEPKDSGCTCTWEEWDGSEPQVKDYMPEWPQRERTHLQMYETCTEGTPISPVMATPEELARWLADNNASAFGDQGATYEQWLATCKSGWAPSAVYTPKTGLVSGVEGTADLKKTQ